MAQRTLDEWTEEFADLLAKTEDFDVADTAELRRILYNVRCMARAWKAETERGGPERRKQARHKRAKARRPIENVELEFEV